MSVDEQLLANQASKKSDQSGADQADNSSGGSDTSSKGGAGGDLRSQQMAAKKAKALELKKEAEKKEMSVSFMKSRILVENIANLISSLGTTLFYIIYHWFQSKLGNKKKYVPLGSEWFDAPGMTVAQRDEIGSRFHTVENCCFVSLVSGCIVAVIISFTPIFVVGYMIMNPENILLMPGVIWDLFKGWLSDLL
jgi:hypothetical protein